jgi:long-chain acyl-CoA synthetase
MLMFLLECPGLTAARVASMERVMYGGSAIAPDRLSRALEIFEADFQQVYGQTEACVFATILHGEDHRAGLLPSRAELQLSCGRESLGYAVRVVDEQDRELPPGEIGEMAIRGASVMQGYWKLPKETARALKNGWLHTGDMGRRDNDNYFYIVDRKIDLIVSGGENVYPVEVENVISAHPNVLEVAVIGVPDDNWGEAVKAIVVARKGAQISPTEIIEFCRDKIARFKTPKSIDFAGALPRTPSGKVKKTELRKPYWAKLERGVN